MYSTVASAAGIRRNHGFNTKVDVADTELEENEAVVAEAEDVTLEDEALVEAESDTDEDDEEADESEDSLTYSNGASRRSLPWPPARFRTFWA